MNKVIVITGPTSVGKTKLSIALAKHYNGEIINADSTQVYIGLDIATAKIKESEKEGIKHHLIDIKNINEEYTVFDYQLDARKAIKDIERLNKTPIIVGGTGLYIKAALYDYKFNEENIKYDYSNYSNEELYNKWLTISPKTLIHINNRKRVERAISYFETTGKIITDEITTNLLYDTVFIGLTTNRKTLYDKINKRVDDMIENGLIEEAKKLYETNNRSRAVMTPIGYKELFDYFDNLVTLDNTIDLIKQKSRRYAKKQYTWFNNQMDINWFDVNYDNFDETINQIINYIDKI